MSSTTSTPAAAPAAPQVVPVSGELLQDDLWKSYAADHRTRAYGEITFTPAEFGGGRLSIRLRTVAKPDKPSFVFSDEVTWDAGDLSKKTVATEVLSGTHYTVDAKVGPVDLTSFAGFLHTA